MEMIGTHTALKALSKKWRTAGARVGLVPTMGALHAGHGALMDAARKHCDKVIVTIFINPMQFSHSEDGDRYPRSLEKDKALMEQHGVDAAYAPALSDVYDDEFSSSVKVTGGLTEGLCGAHRPHHFEGVTTVVLKLFNMALPHDAFFGEKDYQQYVVIKRMAHDFNMDIKVWGIPTVRDADGLALSSRNVYLSDAERTIAVHLYAGLREGARLARKENMDGERLALWGCDFLLGKGFRAVDYFTLVDGAHLTPLDEWRKGARLCGAAHLGAARLIDNIAVD